jgi:hypothetical protein
LQKVVQEKLDTINRARQIYVDDPKRYLLGIRSIHPSRCGHIGRDAGVGSEECDMGVPFERYGEMIVSVTRRQYWEISRGLTVLSLRFNPH